MSQLKIVPSAWRKVQPADCPTAMSNPSLLKFQLGHIVENFKLNLLLLKIWNLIDK
jgi:hypothetical protein